MPINVLNRFGPISFSSVTNKSSGSAINALLTNFTNIGSSNFSLSSSFTSLQKRTGNSDTDTSENPSLVKSVGVGIINNDQKTPIKFSEFYGSSFLSASFTLSSVSPTDGVCEIKIYSPSLIVNNNFLSNNSQDQVFKYTLYSKTDTTTPIIDSGWNKIYSYSKIGDNSETFYNLVSNKAYKLVAKDCFSNAFTSSMFIGTCTNTNTNNSSYSYNINEPDLDIARSVLFTRIINDTIVNGYTQTQINDIRLITQNLKDLLQNPKSFKSENEFYPKLTYTDIVGKTRTITFDGLIFQRAKSQSNLGLGTFYNGLVTATSNGGTIPSYQYSFENTSTFGQIYFYILNNQTSTGTGCTTTPDPQTTANFPSIISFQGPRCGNLDCGTGKPQLVCEPTSVNQIRHSGSFTITNNNNEPMTVDISSNWLDENGLSISDYLKPIIVQPSSTTISALSFKKFSVSFNVQDYANENIPTQFVAKTTATLTLPSTYTPTSQTCEIKAMFDKNSCIITVPPPVVVTPTSNIGCVGSSGGKRAGGRSFAQIKQALTFLINSNSTPGTTADKFLATTIVNAVPTTGCIFPTTVDNMSLTWTIDPSVTPNFCKNSNYAGQTTAYGKYIVDIVSPIYGIGKYTVHFSRTNIEFNSGTLNSMLICQLGGISTPIPPPPPPDNTECIFTTADDNQSWNSLQTETKTLITNSDFSSTSKIFLKSIVDAIPSSGCSLSTSQTVDTYPINLNWSIVTSGTQPYVCNTQQFSGTYLVTTTNPTLGTNTFNVTFLRQNSNITSETYINICPS